MDKLDTLIACLPDAPFKTNLVEELTALRAEVAAQQAQMYEDRRQALVWRDQVAALTKELQKRDKCSYMGPMRDCPTHGIGPELAVAQADNAKLRKTISDKATAIAFYGDQPPQWMLDLIALPADDSALQSALKAERERICGLYSPDDTASDFMDKIRGLA